MARRSQAEWLPEFARVLGCQSKAVQARLMALGHVATCSRCGGSGHYSRCQMYGTMCFGCGGAGKVAVKLTDDLLATVRVQVANGELGPYLDRLARKVKVKRYMDRLHASWEAQPTVAADKAAGKHWSEQSRRCADINSFCAPLAEEATKICIEIEAGKRWDAKAPAALANLRLGAWVVLSDLGIDLRLARLAEIAELVSKAEEIAPHGI